MEVNIHIISVVTVNATKISKCIFTHAVMNSAGPLSLVFPHTFHLTFSRLKKRTTVMRLNRAHNCKYILNFFWSMKFCFDWSCQKIFHLIFRHRSGNCINSSYTQWIFLHPLAFLLRMSICVYIYVKFVSVCAGYTNRTFQDYILAIFVFKNVNAVSFSLI